MSRKLATAKDVADTVHSTIEALSKGEVIGVDPTKYIEAYANNKLRDCIDSINWKLADGDSTYTMGLKQAIEILENKIT